MFDTPFRSAALGLSIVAVAVLALSQSDRAQRLLDRHADAAARLARRERFKTYAIVLIAFSVSLVVLSEALR